jgi:hypothetical protein
MSILQAKKEYHTSCDYANKQILRNVTVVLLYVLARFQSAVPFRPGMKTFSIL